jgi:hypothetical protein
LFSQSGLAHELATPFANRSGLKNEKWNVRSDHFRHFRQRFTGQIRLEQLIERQQSGSCVAASATKTGAMWNSLFEFDRNTAANVRFFEKNVRRAHHNIVFSLRYRRIIASKRDLLFAGALLDLDLVTKRNRRDKRLDFVKAIAATAENPKRKINFRGSEDLHNLQFALSFRAKSRNHCKE